MTHWYLGTSGWSYSWNKEKTLTWYQQHTPVSCIELNMSYYRYPTTKMVASWEKLGKNLMWFIKVHRSITHYKKLNHETPELYNKFKSIFSSLEQNIAYYLFQFPATFTDFSVVKDFIKTCGSKKIALEFRNQQMMCPEIQKWAHQKKILLVSVDAPDLPTQLQSYETVYLRLHGKQNWYDYNYSQPELTDIYHRVKKHNPYHSYVFFNNYQMYPNLLTFHQILSKKNEI